MRAQASRPKLNADVKPMPAPPLCRCLQSLKEEEKDAGREVEAAKKLLRQLEALNRGK